MARLLVYRGEALDRELELSRLPFRIGRAATNDLVLEDPGKSVSREHAEIRLEGGRYVLVDRQSENGIWVEGARLSVVPLERHVVASIGPFRLKVEGAPATAALPDDGVTVARNIASVLPPLPGVPPAPGPLGNAVGSDEIIGGLTAGAPPPPPPPPPPPASATAKTAAKTPARTAAPAAKGRPAASSNNKQTWVVGAGAAIVVALLIAIGLLVARSMRNSAPAPPDVSPFIAAATQQLGQGACAEALAQNILPGLSAAPNNTELLTLKERADTCVASAVPPGTPSPEDAARTTLTQARDLITQNNCAGALEQINFVLLTFPNNAEAQAMKAEAEKCAPVAVATATPAPTPRPAAAGATRIAPENGGLEPLANEKDADYRARVDAMRARYDAAVAAAARTPNRITINALDAIARETGPRYLEIATKLADARREYRASAGKLMAEGRDAAAKEQWKQALDRFSQAIDIDSSLATEGEAAIAKTRADMQSAGAAACRQARQYSNYPDRQAQIPALWEKVLLTLPESDSCYVSAKQALNR